MFSLPASPVTNFPEFGATAGSPSVAEVVCISIDLSQQRIERFVRLQKKVNMSVFQSDIQSGRGVFNKDKKWIRLPPYSATIRRAAVQL